MKTGFVLSSSSSNLKPFKNQPLGSLQLMTVLDEEFGSDIEQSLIDLRAVDPANAIFHIPEKDVYFYSVTSPDYPEIKEIVRNIRERYPKAVHVAGGPHVEIFKDVPEFDALSFGDGEENIKEIVRDTRNSRLKKVYRQKTKLDLKDYPFPSRKYMPHSAVAQTGVLNQKHEDVLGTDVLFSRGCPFACHFCANLTQGKTNFRSPEAIYEEIMYLKREYGVQGLAIKDDQSIPVGRDIARPTLEAIAKAGVLWRGQSRANGVHPDMVKLAKESGCIEIAVGIESLSQEVLNAINKKIDYSRAIDYLSQLRKSGVDRKLLLILGLPGEKKDIADRTIQFIQETEPTNVLLSLLCPMPGSEIYHNPRNFGINMDYSVPFDKYRTTFGRFDEKEKPRLIFHYDPVTPFGKSLSNEEIIENYTRVQAFLRDNHINC